MTKTETPAGSGRHRAARRTAWLSTRSRVLIAIAGGLLVLIVAIPMGAEAAEGGTGDSSSEAIDLGTTAVGTTGTVVIDDAAEPEDDGSVAVWLGCGVALAAFCLFMVREGGKQS